MKLHPAHLLAWSFLFLILTGTLLLMVPAATTDRHHLSFIDALFEATSAVCVTGLAVVDTGTTFTLFGEIVLLVLIQLGGWGFMTSGIMMFILLGKKIGLKQRLLLQESLNAFSIQGVILLARKVLAITVIVEAIGAFFLAIRWAQEMTVGKAVYYGIFHSVSAFNNAGFGLEPDSLSKWAGDPAVNLTITGLFILGGIGFFVVADVLNKRNLRRVSLHTKIVLLFTLGLNIISTLVILTLEYHNPGTLGTMEQANKWWAAYFQGVVTRTAGFNTVNIGELTLSSQVFMMGLMLIGAAPGSTGGGIKVTTFALMLFALWAVVANRQEIHVFKRRIPNQLVFRALSISVLSILINFIFLFLLTISEPGVDLMLIAFETVSAFGTVGMSAGLTPDLSSHGKILITVLMFIGRVGPLTLAFALANRTKQDAKIGYPDEKILLG
ncbi:TrkH family potassium uptake protein [Bacillus sp. FJAT-27251]|uniref:TrkH family potassium uptake protein n=1 Tax=Bacillus sp. FJAT-27251 TaxID=1684142 RepID=UPI000A81F8E6|nr:TrkH family potassium uptake protein [Bacillus sp. FJAT-27251]